jgi:cation transport protein ChaC
MWDPFFPSLRRDRAILPGYHRAFVTSFSRVWGRPDSPCVVLGLEEGGSCEGVAYQVETEQVAGIEEELQAFEGAAFEVTRRTVLINREEVEAILALNRRPHPDYLDHVSETERVGMVLRSRGPDGSCLSYALKTARALKQLGIRDPGVERFVGQLELARG